MASKHRIAVALGEARDSDDDLGEAVIEILAEAARLDHLGQVLVGGADDPRVDGDRLPAADPLDHPFLDEAKQLDLERQRDVADLVEEQGAAMGELDLALVGLDRSGEGALLVAEQFGLEQVLGDGGAVDRDEGAAGAVARLVEAAGEQFLAGAAGAEQHHRHAGIGDPLDRPGDLEHLRSAGDHRPEHRLVLADPLLELAVLGLDAVQLEGAADDQAELVDVDRLLVEIVGAGRDRPKRALAGAVARGDDDLGLGLQRQDRLQRGEALGDSVGVGRQAEVERDDRRLLRAKQVDRRVAIGGDQHLIIVIGPAQLALQPLVVLDDQQFRPGVHAHALIRPISEMLVSPSGKKTVKRLPSPARLSTSIRPPIAAIRLRASKAPTPKPLSLVEAKGWNRRVRMKSADMPSPRSTIAIVASDRLGAAAYPDRRSVRAGVDRVLDEMAERLLEPHRIGDRRERCGRPRPRRDGPGA